MTISADPASLFIIVVELVTLIALVTIGWKASR